MLLEGKHLCDVENMVGVPQVPFSSTGREKGAGSLSAKGSAHNSEANF